MKRSILTLALVLSVAVAGSASAQDVKPAKPATPPRQCFWINQVNGFSSPNQETVYVNVSVRDVYELKLFGPCLNVDWTQRIGLKPWGGMDNVCTGVDLDLIVPQGMGAAPMKCHVRAMRKLTETEVQALKTSKKK